MKPHLWALSVPTRASQSSRQSFCRGNSCGFRVLAPLWWCFRRGIGTEGMTLGRFACQVRLLESRFIGGIELQYRLSICCLWCARSGCHRNPYYWRSHPRVLSAGHVLSSFLELLILSYWHYSCLLKIRSDPLLAASVSFDCLPSPNCYSYCPLRFSRDLARCHPRIGLSSVYEGWLTGGGQLDRRN